MAAGTLYTYPNNFRAQKILIAAQYSGSAVKVVDSASFEFGVTNQTGDFKKKFPLGKVPAFEGKDGKNLFDANAIAFHVSNKQLRGDEAAMAEVIQWVNFADSEITPATVAWAYPTLGIVHPNKNQVEIAKKDMKLAFETLNHHLNTRTYLVGERITLADITVACHLIIPYVQVLAPEFRNEFVNVNRWFTTLINQPQFKKVVGTVTLCTKEAQFDAQKYADVSGKPAGGPKKEAKPNQKKQQPAKKAEAKTEEAEEEPKPKPSKNPFESMPAGNWDMDEWKRTYSNTDTLTEALPYFFEKFDKQNYSIWHCVYKYPEDLKLVFMTCNLVGGMMQRLDKLRKFGFGSMGIFGENNNSQIAGVWFWRGQELAFDLSADLQIDAPSYEWKKLDFDDPKTKEMIKEYFAWEGKFPEIGKPFNQGKVYK